MAISREEWGGSISSKSRLDPRTLPGVELHHTVTSARQSAVNAAKAVHKLHVQQRKGGIWYGFLVHQDGTIVEGRGYDYRSTPAKGLAIALIGNYEHDVVTPEQKLAVHLLRLEARDHGAGMDVRWHGQRAQTACPGRNVRAWVESGMDNPLGNPWAGGAPKPAPKPAGPKPAPAGVRLPTLRRGARGDLVRRLQGMLYACGQQGVVGPIDGVFGRRTEAGVKNVQRYCKVRADGIVGPVTWGILLYVESHR